MLQVIAALLLATAAIVWLVGLLLPEEHRLSRELVLRQSPETVFSLVADVSNTPRWRKELSLVEMLSDSRYVEHGEHGAVEYVVEESIAPSRFKTRIASVDLPYTGTWVIDIIPEPAGCRIRITETGRVRNPIFRFLSRFVFGHQASMDTYLKAAARHFDEPAVVQTAP